MITDEARRQVNRFVVRRIDAIATKIVSLWVPENLQ